MKQVRRPLVYQCLTSLEQSHLVLIRPMPIVCMTGRTSGHAMDLVGRSTAIRSVDDLPLRSARVVLVERVRVRLVPHLVLGLVS